MLKSTHFVIITLLSLSFCGCGGRVSSDATDNDPHRAVVSIEPLRLLVADVAGEGWMVESLAGAGANPETFDPTVSTMRTVDAATLFFTTGSLGFESDIIRRMSHAGSVTVNLAEAIVPVTGTHHDHNHSDGDDHADIADPHIWNSLRNAAAITRLIGSSLAHADSVNADYYIRRADSIAALYQRADSAMASVIKPQTAFLTGHPSLSYFARDYHMRQISVGADNKELSVGAMRQALAGAKSGNASVYFAESTADSARMSSLARQAGVTIVVINPLDPDIRHTLNRAAEALK